MKARLFLFVLMAICINNAYSQRLKMPKPIKRELTEQQRQLALVASEDAMEELLARYKVDSLCIPALRQMILTREQKKMSYSHAANPARVRVREKRMIDSLYMDSVNTILIPQNLDISGRTISMALRMAGQIRLPEKKEKRLMKAALGFARVLKNNPCAYIAKDEIDVLKKNLSTRQLEYVIDEKNKLQALILAQKAWDALEAEGRTEELDSTQQMIRAEMYYKYEMRYHDLYVDDGNLLAHNLNDLHKSKPKIIRMYDALLENKRIKDEKKTVEKNVSSAFSW